MSLAPSSAAPVTIEPWSVVLGGRSFADATADVLSLDAIFFEASGTKSFASDDARSQFRERWLGRYLDAPDALVLVARDARECNGGAAIVGYVIGMFTDPAADARFSDIAYFKDLAPQTALFPAHLHINCAPEWRGQGVGALLIDAFCASAARRGAPGVHVVTGAGLRNVGFYERNGFRLVGRALSNGKPVVMLGRVIGRAL